MGQNTNLYRGRVPICQMFPFDDVIKNCDRTLTHKADFQYGCFSVRHTNHSTHETMSWYRTNSVTPTTHTITDLLLYVSKFYHSSWWRHQMETFSALLATWAGNSPVSGEFPAQRPVTLSFHFLFDLRLNKRLSKQPWGWWFETIVSKDQSLVHSCFMIRFIVK